jgi:hypothetical protein
MNFSAAEHSTPTGEYKAKRALEFSGLGVGFSKARPSRTLAVFLKMADLELLRRSDAMLPSVPRQCRTLADSTLFPEINKA